MFYLYIYVYSIYRVYGSTGLDMPGYAPFFPFFELVQIPPFPKCYISQDMKHDS